jgi:two-component system sensor histidine kinase QseC
MNSIRRTLLVSILCTATIVLSIAAAFSYSVGLQEADELFDAKLAHSSRVLMSLVDEPLADLEHNPGNGRAGDARVIKVWHGQVGGEGDELALPDGHAYETKLAFQVRTADGQLLLRSDSGPAVPLAPLEPGFTDQVIAGEHWRTFTLKAPSGRWYQSGEQSSIRGEIAEEIALGTLVPLLIALPLLALFVWLAVGWACRSLVRVSDAVAQRAPERLEPIHLVRVPSEVHGLVGAVNGLLERLDLALSRERRFTADAAHELRTPIAAVKVHAWNLRQAEDDAERAQSQRLLDAGIGRMERLVTQLLALSRIESGSAPAPMRQRIDLADVVRRHQRDLDTVGTLEGRRLELALQPATVIGDESAIDALVRNLIDNAMRYAPPGGTVAVGTDSDGARARLVVEDSGPGIPQEARARVFERFHRELGTGVEGSGLGLAIVAETLRLHGGEIALDASPTLGGLRATVSLPAV